MDKWLSTSDVARLTGYTYRHIRRLIETNRITAKKVVTVWLIERDSLLAYVKKTEKLGKRRGPKSEG